MKTETQIEFVEALGLILQRDGLPRIAGRLLGLFVLEGGPFSFAELSERLEISRASVSTNTRLLEDLGMIERVARPGERQDFFRLADAPYHQLIARKCERARRAEDTVKGFASDLAADDDDVRARILELSGFFGVVGTATENALGALGGSGSTLPLRIRAV